jgi:hypothetical protein
MECDMFADGDQSSIAMWTAISAIITALIGAALTAFNTWIGYRLKTMIKDNTAITAQTKDSVNGRMDELLEVEKKVSYEQGIRQGKAEAAKKEPPRPEDLKR